MKNPLETVRPSDLPMVFILAKGRSGTTLFQTMLDSHPETIAPLESRFVAHFYQKYSTLKQWSDRKKEEFIKDIVSELKIRYFWNLDVQGLRERIANLPASTTYGAMCKQVYASQLSPFEKSSPKVIIDKNPIYPTLLPIINKVFPDARYIQVVRDYRANVSSFLKFQPNQSIQNLGYKWNLYLEKIERFKATKPDCIYSIRYEDLVEDPKNTMKGVLQFLNLPFNEAVVTYQDKMEKIHQDYLKAAPDEKIKAIREGAIKEVHANLTKPLDPNLMHTWKKKLTPEQIEQLNEICGFYGSRFGYLEGTGSLPYKKAPWLIWLEIEKLYWYYSLPIWFRELKSKPDLGLYTIEE